MKTFCRRLASDSVQLGLKVLTGFRQARASGSKMIDLIQEVVDDVESSSSLFRVR